VDEVKSYAGLRKVSLGRDGKGFTRILLNNRPLFQAGLLDQGYWPDGIYTPPTDAAMRNDLALLKRMGFNLARKHAKVEPARWYYACDQMGVLVWQDMPSGAVAGKGSDKGDGEVNSPRRLRSSPRSWRPWWTGSRIFPPSFCGRCSTKGGASTTRCG
jgi:beta-galactosidase/beta-glucuronidase